MTDLPTADKYSFPRTVARPGQLTPKQAMQIGFLQPHHPAVPSWLLVRLMTHFPASSTPPPTLRWQADRDPRRFCNMPAMACGKPSARPAVRKVRLARKAQQAQLAQPVLLVRKARWVPQDQRVQRGTRVIQVQRVRKARWVPLVLQERRERKGHRAIRVRRVHKAQQVQPARKVPKVRPTPTGGCSVGT